MATKKISSPAKGASSKGRKQAVKTGTRTAGAKAPSPKSMPKAGRDPKGGLTAKGREYFNKKEGSHLRPGVQGPADTPEKMVRKGSFLRRHFTHPRGPMKDETGQPTRLALSAHAWGEPVPNTPGDAKKLAQKGHVLLDKYHAAKDGVSGKAAKTTAMKKGGAKVAGKPPAKAVKSAGRKQTARTAQKAAKKVSAKAAKKVSAKAAKKASR